MARKGIMLCYPFEERRFDQWGMALIQPKLDGDRCLAVILNGQSTLLSSEANEIVSVPHINHYLDNLGLPDMVLDGELYIHGTSHQEIHGIVSRRVELHYDFDQVKYHVFDLKDVGLQLNRIVRLSDLNLSDPVIVVSTNVVTSLNQVMDYAYQFEEEGYEGFILRHPHGLYTDKRYTGIMKFKPRKEDYYTVVGFTEEISITGEPKGSLGAITCVADNLERFNVGTGPFLTRENREQLWHERDKLIGSVAQVKYQHLTKAGVPRFPVLFELMKGDKP